MTTSCKRTDFGRSIKRRQFIEAGPSQQQKLQPNWFKLHIIAVLHPFTCTANMFGGAHPRARQAEARFARRGNRECMIEIPPAPPNLKSWIRHCCYLGRLFRLQKKVVRLMYGRPLCEHTAPYFTLGNLLNIFDIYKLNCAVFIFKLMYNRFPTFFNNKFYDQIFVYVGSALGTRNNNLLQIPRCRTVLRQKFLIYTSVKLFNDFLYPYGLFETSASLKMFKINVTGILIADYV